MRRGIKTQLHQDGHFDPPWEIEGMNLYGKCAHMGCDCAHLESDAHTWEVTVHTWEWMPTSGKWLPTPGKWMPTARKWMPTPRKWLESWKRQIDHFPRVGRSLPREGHGSWPLPRWGQVTSQGGPTSPEGAILETCWERPKCPFWCSHSL